MVNGVPLMDKVYYYNNDLYIRITDKNDHMITYNDLKDNDILVWEIDYTLKDINKGFETYLDSCVNTSIIDSYEDVFELFKKDILSSLKYKVYKKVKLNN